MGALEGAMDEGMQQARGRGFPVGQHQQDSSAFLPLCLSLLFFSLSQHSGDATSASNERATRRVIHPRRAGGEDVASVVVVGDEDAQSGGEWEDVRMVECEVE